MTGITLVRLIAAAPETVFDAMTTPEAIAQWWGPDDGPVLSAEFDGRTGGRFAVRFRMLDGTEHECSGEVLELVRPVRLVIVAMARQRGRGRVAHRGVDTPDRRAHGAGLHACAPAR